MVLNYSQTSQAGFDFVNTDVIRGETSYDYGTLRDTVFERAWWAPLVTVYGRARTELDVPATQPYRWADVDGLLERYPVLTLGASELQVRLGGGTFGSGASAPTNARRTTSTTPRSPASGGRFLPTRSSSSSRCARAGRCRTSSTPALCASGPRSCASAPDSP